jgi:hypothetical protein
MTNRNGIASLWENAFARRMIVGDIGDFDGIFSDVGRDTYEDLSKDRKLGIVFQVVHRY